MLAPLGVRFIVVPVVDGGLSTRSRPIAAPAGLVDAMARQLDLRRRYVSPDIAIFENSAWVPVTSMLTARGVEAAASAGAESVIATDISGGQAVLPGLPGDEPVTGEVPPGVLHLAVPYTSRWTVTGSDGSRRAPTPAFGLTNAYDLTSGAGRVTVAFDSSFPLTATVVVVSLVWLVMVRVAVPRRRRRARRTGAVYTGDAAITMGASS
jgi:hypothetical protein